MDGVSESEITGPSHEISCDGLPERRQTEFMRQIMTFLLPFLILFCMIFGNELGGTFSFYPVLKAEAAEYTTYVSDKDGVDGLVDYENGSVDYMV